MIYMCVRACVRARVCARVCVCVCVGGGGDDQNNIYDFWKPITSKRS